ncbi:MAG: LLM class flavin-dependent oxidoreductase [Candidatus Binataceae bacterium]
MNPVKFGLFLPTGDFSAARAAAQWADTTGFYSISINDHFFSPMGAPQTPQLECFSTLSALATITNNVRLVPAVAAMSFRTPPMLAKMASTLDHLSGGRLIMGIGAGWQRSEYDAHGYPYPSNLERIEQLGDAIRLMKAMWTQSAPTYHGRFFSVDNAYNNPRPVQKPHPPIMIGGSGKRMLELVAAEAQLVNMIPPIVNGKDFIQDPAAAVKFDKAELKRRIGMLREMLIKVRRPRDAVELSVMCLVNVARSKNDADTALAAVARTMGYPNPEAARLSPVLLYGTPEEVRRELRARIEELGTTYFIVFPSSPESGELLVKQVMPEFVSR